MLFLGWVTWRWKPRPQPPNPEPTQLARLLASPGSYLLHLLHRVVASGVLDHRVCASSWGQEQGAVSHPCPRIQGKSHCWGQRPAEQAT